MRFNFIAVNKIITRLSSPKALIGDPCSMHSKMDSRLQHAGMTVLIIFFIVFITCTSYAAPKTVNSIAAIVDNDVITNLDVEQALKRDRKNPSDRNQRTEVISQLIDDLIFKQITERSKV